MEDFITYCKQYIYDHIDDYRGQKVYPCDLGFTLTEYPNCDGTLTYSREEAKNYIREWWDGLDYSEKSEISGISGADPDDEDAQFEEGQRIDEWWEALDDAKAVEVYYNNN